MIVWSCWSHFDLEMLNSFRKDLPTTFESIDCVNKSPKCRASWWANYGINIILECLMAEMRRDQTIFPAHSVQNQPSHIWECKKKPWNSWPMPNSTTPLLFKIKLSHPIEIATSCSCSESTGWIGIKTFGIWGRQPSDAVMPSLALDVHPSSTYVYPCLSWHHSLFWFEAFFFFVSTGR